MKLSKFVNAMLVFGGLRSTNLTVSGSYIGIYLG